MLSWSAARVPFPFCESSDCRVVRPNFGTCSVFIFTCPDHGGVFHPCLICPVRVNVREMSVGWQLSGRHLSFPGLSALRRNRRTGSRRGCTAHPDGRPCVLFPGQFATCPRRGGCPCIRASGTYSWPVDRRLERSPLAWSRATVQVAI